MRRRREGLELAVGVGLLLGPLMFALTLPRPGEVAATCDAEPAAEPTPEVIVVEVCEREPAPEPTPAPEPAPEPEPVLDGALPFVFVNANGLVFSTEAAPEWGTGRFHEPPGDATFRVGKRAKLSQLPATLLAQRGRSFDLYGPNGKVCSARVGELRVISQYDGWSLDEVMGEDIWERYEDPEDIPKRMWRDALWAREGHWLVAEIESDHSCEGALWARDAALPAPMILRPTQRETSEGTARIATFERSDELAQTRAEYTAWYDALPPEAREYEQTWQTMANQAPASVTSWVDGANHVRLVELDFGSDTESCGDGFAARITSLDLVDGDSFIDTGRYTDVTAIFDADLDGKLEYLYVEAWDSGMMLTSESEALDLSLMIDRDFVCPC
ncbi:hypothetical protein [Enhygromyxa salina]|uniref:Uncharacterized protein n=1 Tax=Enhygromyxa salina TaxID=215803 RepID=A0A2S9YV00_9BACT|nr:hypothetical protein [Enhygromyxa salina]PRQ08916.1 hypothetical protein ENSA7_13150 [Enhygromyxa salina]